MYKFYYFYCIRLKKEKRNRITIENYENYIKKKKYYLQLIFHFNYFLQL